ncbi:restriction endonuclease [Variovorax paradoxus]|uniref:Restriction endonuclease n=1 Tax=Variovorax paradoxus TaxID=34073 RepID=A0A0D0LPN9_VARPD|nr:restriction endonuclease [Variovorax paradoxus]KIQ21946.1 restriction endonuclease [Variovorax paradoxus]
MTQTLWGIHAGKTGDANSLFLKKKVIALGWHAMGNLAVLTATREAFKQRYAAVYPVAAKSKPGQVPTSAGQLFRFVHEMQINDLVVYPSKNPREIHLGRVIGDYVHDAGGDPLYPQRRRVEWLKTIPRSHFSQGALYEIGSAMSLFVVKNYADEFLSAIQGKQPPPVVPVAKDDSVAEISQDVEETARDYVLKVLAQQTKGHPFAHFVANLLQTMGYRTRVSPEGSDGGIDIVAHTDELGFAPPIIKVQIKSTEGSIGGPAIRELAGNVAPTEFGLFVTLGYFTKQATEFARSKSNLRLIDGDALVELVLGHYEALDAKYKALIPMRRVYIPEPVLSDSTAD